MRTSRRQALALLFVYWLALEHPGPARADDLVAPGNLAASQVPPTPPSPPIAPVSTTANEPNGTVKGDPAAGARRKSQPQLEAKYGSEAGDNPEHDGAECAPPDKGIQLSLTWTDGLVGESADKDFRIHVGGRFDFDSTWYSVPANVQESLGSTPLLDGTDLRRFRFRTDGTIYQQMDFALEADFSKAGDFKTLEDTPQTNIFLTDAWVALRDIPWIDTVKIGHQKEYLTFSNGTSANCYPFMERPFIFDAYEDNFSWDSGISMNRTYLDQHATSWLGVFWNGTRSQAFNVGDQYAISGRLTCLPIYNEAEQQWLNLGVSGSWRSAELSTDPTSVTVRPLVRAGESFQVPNLIDTGQLFTRDGLQIAGAGVHGAWGRFTVGSEFLCWFINNAYSGSLPNPNGTLPPGSQADGNLFFSGFYVEALYFLTPGDHHPINRIIPGYDRVRPVRNFLCRHDGSDGPRGLGAWEVGLRYDHVDVNSGLIQGGRLDSITAGLNWYLNPNAHIMLNYVWTEQNVANPAADGSFSGLGMRLHLDF